MSIADKLVAVAENQQKVFDAGAKSEWDKFWDVFQTNGERRNYFQAFNEGWTDENYAPKYPIHCSGSGNSARNIFQSNANITDVKAPMIVDGCAMNSTFYWTSSLKRIPSLTLLNGVTFLGSPFRGCAALQELNVYGAIENNDFDVSSCTSLTHDSLMTIINALKDYADSGTTYTVTLGATNLAKLTAEEKKIATDKGWTLA